MTRLARPSVSILTGAAVLLSLVSRSWAWLSPLACPGVVAAVLSAASPALLPGVAAPLPVLPLLVLPLPVLPLAGVAGSAPGLLPSSSRPFAGRPSISGPNGDGVDAASGTRNGR